MKYYVVINGESSLNIQGLAIQSLPNISKPLMRSRREEIDGRDGDIITKLGYSAYDKTLKIGLWGNYDINQVIAFFNQEGVITFSNEPDKYYNFTILNREDYINQLEAFREASITIHCQPYKYELNEQPVELDNEYVTKTDTSMTFDNSVVADMDISLKGNTLQNGTPTPSSPIPINNVSGDNQVVISDGASDTTTYNIDLPVENLLNITNKTETVNDVVCKYENGTITLNGTCSSNGFFVLNLNTSLPSGNYSLSANNETTTSADTIIRLDSNNTGFQVKLNNANASYSGTYNATISTLAIRLNNGTQYSNFTFKPQLEKGLKVNSYTPYGTTPIELNKIGTYQDYIYKDSDKWYLHKEIGKEVLDGSESWEQNGENDTYGQFIYNVEGKANGTLNLLCNRFVNESGANGNYIYGRTSNNRTSITIAKSICAYNVNTFKTWLANNNTYFYFLLATPTNTEITYTPLIEQLESIKNAMSKEGTTNVNQVNNDAPFIITASVLCGGSSVVVNNKGNIYSKPIMTIYGSGTIGVYLSDSQIFNINLGDEEYITLDTANMEAYKVGVLKNRLVSGDYNSFKLETGNNTISFTGNVIKVELENYSRWI